MPIIKITVKDKKAIAGQGVYVCSNSDYTLNFEFDDEWNSFATKTARFTYRGEYTDVVFSGTECSVPLIHNTDRLYVGVYAGDLHTTTPAVIPCVKSVLSEESVPAEPTEDVYNQIMAAVNEKIQEPETEGTDGQALVTDGKGGRRWETIEGGGSGGTTDHAELINRDAENQHPITAIEGLQATLDKKANAEDVPTKVSQLENDSGFLTEHQDISGKQDKATLDADVAAAGFIKSYTETDPTVPDWAKAATKPTYTAEEVGALPDTTVIPDVSGKEDTTNKITSLSADSTDAQYPSAKCVYDLVGDVKTLIDNL